MKETLEQDAILQELFTRELSMRQQSFETKGYDLVSTYKAIRQHSEYICKPLKTEDYVVQPVVDVSPPKWHLGHTTWFFETFLLKPYMENYQEFNSAFNFVFNSYYESVGARVIRTNRGNLSRPTVEEIYNYRHYVDEAMEAFLCTELSQEIKEFILLYPFPTFRMPVAKVLVTTINDKFQVFLIRYKPAADLVRL